MVVKNRASGGTERRMWCKNAVLQFGSLGCKRAHDRLVIAGCAGPVIGEMEATDDGKVLRSPGCRIGETNALCHISDYTPEHNQLQTYGQRRSAMEAREFTISSFSGQAMLTGSDSGRP